jgi:YVTN family beta-propeller protein
MPARRDWRASFQTNAAGDNIHVIDPATNKVVGIINDIEVPHGVTAAPDGTRLYFTNESRETVDVVDGSTFAIIARVPLSGRPEQHRGLEGRQARVCGHRAGAGRR